MCHVSDGLYNYTCAILEPAQCKQEMESDQKSPSYSVFSQFGHQNLYKSVNLNLIGDFSLLLAPRHSTDRREV